MELCTHSSWVWAESKGLRLSGQKLDVSSHCASAGSGLNASRETMTPPALGMSYSAKRYQELLFSQETEPTERAWAWGQLSLVLLSSYEFWGKLLHLPESQFPYF